jgi:predicted permease
MLADFQRATRALRRSPGFTWAAIATLSLGIGATTAMFSVVYAVLVQPLPLRSPDRIMVVNTKFLNEKGREVPRVTGGDLADLRLLGEIFESLATYGGGELGVQVAKTAEFVTLHQVDHTFFDVLGVQPMAGRAFIAQDEGHAALVSSSFAQRHFGGAADALGQKLSFENHVYEIVGVLARRFAFPAKTEVWASRPWKIERTSRSAYNYRAVARLRDGVTIQQANERLNALGVSLEASHPGDNKGKRFTVNPLQEQTVRAVRGTLLWLLSAVGLLLLIACANVASLMLARATRQAREIAVRFAAGATRWHIARQLLAESLVLAVAGGLGGVFLALWGSSLLINLAPGNLPRLAEVELSLPVLGFAAAIALSSSLLFGLLPAFQASRHDIMTTLRKGARNLTGGSLFARNGIIAAEIALSFCLLLGAGSLFQTLITLATADLGFSTEKLLVMYAHKPARTLDDAKQATRFFEELFTGLGQLPGVRSVAGAMGMPIGRYGSNGFYETDAHRFAGGELSKSPRAGFRLTSPGYFATLGVRLRQGRDFAANDQYDTPFVAIVSQSLARQSFGATDPLGKRIRCGLDSDKWMTIVGVVDDIRNDAPGEKPGPELYMPLTQHPFMANEIQVLMRTNQEPTALIASARALTAKRDPSVAMRFLTMEQNIAESIATPRFRAFLTGAFAACALLLAITGIYGVMSFLAAQRAPEFGIRLSLGAQRSDISRIVFRRALALASAGLAAGALLAWAVLQAAGSVVWGLEKPSLAAVAIAALLVLATSVAAALAPAWRAAHVNPLDTLRSE